jgi:hypothetical protein
MRTEEAHINYPAEKVTQRAAEKAGWPERKISYHVKAWPSRLLKAAFRRLLCLREDIRK